MTGKTSRGITAHSPAALPALALALQAARGRVLSRPDELGVLVQCSTLFAT